MSPGQNMFIKGQSGELALVTSSNIPSPLYLFSQILPPVYSVSPAFMSMANILTKFRNFKLFLTKPKVSRL